jgi:hypothetical protein
MGSRRMLTLLAGLLVTIVSGMPAAATTTATIRVHPGSGPPGTAVRVKGSGFTHKDTCNIVSLSFIDADGSASPLGTARIRGDGSFRTRVIVPSRAAIGEGVIAAREWRMDPRVKHCVAYLPEADHTFLVT